MESRVEETVLSFQGRISVDNSSEMRDSLGAALKAGLKELTVDLSQVTSIDISGLATLVEANRIARQQGTQLVIAGMQGQVELLFGITRLDRILGPAPDRQPI